MRTPGQLHTHQLRLGVIEHAPAVPVFHSSIDCKNSMRYPLHIWALAYLQHIHADVYQDLSCTCLCRALASDENESAEENGGSDSSTLSPSGPSAGSARSLAAGYGAAVSAGVLGGLLLAPMQWSPLSGIQFLPSMAIGAGLASPLVLIAQQLLARARTQDTGHDIPLGMDLRQYWQRVSSSEGNATLSLMLQDDSAPSSLPYRRSQRAALCTAVASGAVWNGGNACSMIATDLVRYRVACCMLAAPGCRQFEILCTHCVRYIANSTSAQSTHSHSV